MTKKLIRTKDASEILKLFEDPTMQATGEYAKGYRDALMQLKHDLKKFLGVKDAHSQN